MLKLRINPLVTGGFEIAGIIIKGRKIRRDKSWKNTPE